MFEDFRIISHLLAVNPFALWGEKLAGEFVRRNPLVSRPGPQAWCVFSAACTAWSSFSGE